MTRMALAIDTVRCTGCQTCSIACKASNKVPDNMLWTRTITPESEYLDGASGVYPNLKRTYLPLGCQHCENAACLRACPVGATYRDEQGRIEVDYDRCIGCRICMAACPYNARSFNWNEPVYEQGATYGDARVPLRHKGVAEKCTLCREATDAGERPMCVRCCPSHARVWGDLDDPGSEVARLAAQPNAYTLLPEAGTRPQVFYIS